MSEFDIEAYLRAKGITNISLLPDKVVLTVPYPPPLRANKLGIGSTLSEAILDLESRSSTQKGSVGSIQEAYSNKEKLATVRQLLKEGEDSGIAEPGSFDRMRNFIREYSKNSSPSQSPSQEAYSNKESLFPYIKPKLLENFSEEIAYWLSVELWKLCEEESFSSRYKYGNSDNYRVARLGDKEQLKQYGRQYNNGCCGFYDEVHTGPDGNRYYIGFNYGH